MNGSGMAVANSVIGGFGNGPDKSKEFQMELLMERLRTKTSQYKTLTETSKAVRMTMLDKRWALDTADRAILQKCLDSLQHSIKVCSFQSLVERLECLSRQLGFKFLVGPSGVDLFISSDMFYLEILLEASGTVKDVKIHHEGKKEQQSCEELVSCISRGDFTDFTAQLEGLTAMYQLNADKKAKAMAFSALAALEADLGTLAQIQATLKDPWAQVHKSPIGFVQKRRGGHAMRLTYFVSPYEVARCPSGSLTAESLNGTNGAGHSVRVLLESAAAHKLQFAPLIAPLAGSRTPNNGPMYSILSASNCVTLPARFVLKLSQPMPVCGALLKMMSAAGEATEGGIPATPIVLPTQDMKPLLSLVAKHSSSVEINPNKGLFVTLPDQNQCYFLTESRGLDGCMVESVPFTHPRQVSTLITRLRQQAIFNALIASCVRPNSKQDLESSLMVEVSALSWQHISVCLEQPGEGGMATLELELPEGSSPRVSIHGGFGGGVAGSASRPDEKLGRVLARTLSIPLLVRALVMGWERERERERETRSGFSGGAGGTDPGGAPPSPSTHYNAHTHHPQGTFLNDPQSNLPLFGNQDTNLSSMMGNSNGGGVGMQASNTPQLMPHQLVSASHQVTFTPVEEKKSSKKRKHDNSDSDGWNKKSKSQAVCEVLLESSSNSSASVEESDQEEEPVHSNSSNDEEEERGASPTSFVGFTSDLDPAELTRDGSSNDNRTSCSEFENSGDGEINDSQDMDDIIRSASTPSKSESKRHKHKNREHGSSSSAKLSSSTSLLMELTEGSSPAVSITPLSPSTAGSIATNSSPGFSSVLGMRLDRRPGIEIIPISSEPRAALIGGSVTITPITPSQAKSMDERHRSDRKSGSSGKSSRSDKDKKKKKRHEDSMGPPEKLPPKQDPLTKPVSVSIKPADGSRSPLSGGSASPLPAGKFSPSPTHGRSVSVSKSSGSGSPGSVKSSGKPSSSSSHHGSPRHSPVRSSPKRAPPGYSSPKNHGTSSPKHISGSGSSGKPSMSALKSAAGGSPSGKSSSSYDLTKPSKGSSGKESSSSSRDKDRKSSGGLSYSSSGGGSPKMKSSTVKLKQLDLSSTMNELHASSTVNDSMISPGPDVNKSATPNQLRNRKGSLSAVIDKLKSAQHCSEPEGTVVKSSSSSSSSGKDRSSNPSSKLNDSKTTSTSGSSKLNDSKTQEYMVKPSSDGMKITFNKTRTKESSSSSGGSKSSGFSGSSSSSSSTPKQSSSSSASSQSTTGTGSPKTHTGLKPGVISGPASKKPQALQSSKTGSLSNSNPSSVSSGSPGSSNKISSNSLSVTGGTSKVPFTKSSSGSSLSSSSAPKSSSKVSTGSPKMSSSANDLSKLGRDREREREREKSRSSKSTSSSGSSSDKSIFSSSKSNERRSSPAPSRDDGDGERAFKMLSQHSKDSGFIVEGLIKSLDTSKYQIPKLSARVPSDDPTKTKNSSSNDKTSTPVAPQTDPSNMSNRNAVNDTSAKILDYMGRQQDLPGSKYSFQHLANSKLPDQLQKSLSSPASSTAKPTINLSSSGPKLQTDPLPLVSASKTVDTTDGLQPSNYSFSSLAKAQSDSVKDSKSDAKIVDSNRTNTGQQIHTGGSTREDSSSNKIDYSKPYPAISVCSADTINQSIVKKVDTHSNKGFTVPQIKPPTEDSARKMLSMSSEPGMKPPPAIGKLPSSSEAAEMLLDFSSSSGSKPGSEIKNKLAAERVTSNMRRHTPPLVLPPQAPSLSVHIVKSPAPSPLIVPSPHSNSPCITDDELMDEAVVGPGK